MGLKQKLRRSFRAPKAPRSSDSARTSPAGPVTKTAPATVSAPTKLAPSRLGDGAKPAPPPGQPAAGDGKTATGAGSSAADRRAGCGCGEGGTNPASAGVGGGASDARSAGLPGSDSRSNAAELAAIPNGTATGGASAEDEAEDGVTVKQLAAQLSEVRAEIASLRALVQSLETRVGKSLTVPRRLPRANSYQPETRSQLTISPSLLEEGPNCVLKDDEFYDALTVSLMHLEQEADKRDELRKKKDEQMKEEQKRQRERSDDAKETKQETGGEIAPNKENEDGEELKNPTGEENEGKHDEDSKDNADSSNTENQQSATAVKPPPKPQRSLSKQSSTGPDAPDSVLAGLPVPLPPAAAPRGGCSGNCSQLGHPLAAEIERVVTEQLGLVSSDVSDGWTLFAHQGDMRMYRMELPADDRSVDPLKAVSKAHGVSARELCRAYWDPNVRLDWETTVDRVTVLARPDPSTVVCHQVHRRIWPAQQRDTVFWSHLCRRRIGDREWSITVNHSVADHPDEPRAPAGAVRAVMTAALAGTDEEEVSGDRRRLRCHVAYSSHVNPGGWAPTTGLRLVYKREYPRFLQRFTAYVTQKSRSKPVEA